MKQITTQAIVLSRTNFGEADRILTLLTPEQGKVRVLAKGVRKVKSKLAGGIELFSTSEIVYLPGRGELGTLVSSRLQRHYGKIVQDIERVQTGYDILKQLNRATEDEPEPEYYQLLEHAFAALDAPKVPLELIRIWFQAQIVAQAGHGPNLRTDTAGEALQADRVYAFDVEAMTFTLAEQGRFTAAHIKGLRLLFSGAPPHALAQVGGLMDVMPVLAPLVRTAFTSYIRT